MKDLTEQIYDELNAQVVRMLNHSLAQASRIADLERQLAEASAPAVEQQPVNFEQWVKDEMHSYFSYSGNSDNRMWALVEDIRLFALAAIAAFADDAPQAADTDKVREAILALDFNADYADVIHQNVFDRGVELALSAAADVAVALAAQAPVREVPGYKLVPIEPTQEMLDEIVGYCVEEKLLKKRYAAMLAAAPLPAAPVQQEPKP